MGDIVYFDTTIVYILLYHESTRNFQTYNVLHQIFINKQIGTQHMKAVLEQTRKYVRGKFEGEGSGHDWWHIQRVVNLALVLAEKEHADQYIVELAALLHDIADYKFHGGDTEIGPKTARAWLESLSVQAPIVDHVCDIVAHVSYKGAGVPTPMKTVEGMVVQDADRLDAMGAIGIGRTFAYGGSKGTVMHNPDVAPQLHSTADAYLNKGNSSVINHFHEKLLLLKDRMNTETAKKMAEERHQFMEQYLEQFHHEWKGLR